MIFAGIRFSGLLSVGYCFAEVPGKFICGAAEASGCAQDVPCLRGAAERLSLPLIWKIDLEQKISGPLEKMVIRKIQKYTR